MRRCGLSLFLILVISFSFQLASAQVEHEAIVLKLRKDFGFSMGGQIQGSFTLSASSPSDLHRVEFTIDKVVVFQDDAPPFEFQFHTSDFELGVHNISAIGIGSSNTQLQSNILRFEFVSAEQGWDIAANVIIPIFIVIIGLGVIATSFSLLFKHKNEFRLGEYNPAGGGVCSSCGLPFSRHLFSPNLIVGKLERCPHCGKWGIVQRAAKSRLMEAEAKFQVESQRGRIEAIDDETKRKRLIEESRFED